MQTNMTAYKGECFLEGNQQDVGGKKESVGGLNMIEVH
jgi:hypothetical protein